jgi:hypothetical protein
MRSTVLGLLTGVLVALVLWRLLRPLFDLPVFQRGVGERRSPTSVGVLLVLTVVLVEAWFAMIHAASMVGDTDATYGRRLVLTGVLGFGLLGMLTDLGDLDGEAGSGTDGVPAVAVLRWVGGAAVALVVAIALPRRTPSLGGLLLDALLVALSAGLGSRLSQMPGRATKLAAPLACLLVAVAGTRSRLAGSALVIGGALALAGPELRGRLRLGDVGGSVIGASLGIGACLILGVPGRSAVLAAVVLASVAGELGWIDRAFERSAVLRAVDRWGTGGTPA